MKKKLIVLALTVISILNLVPTGGFAAFYGWINGGEYTIDLSECVSAENAGAKNAKLLELSGGSAKYEFTLPFYSDKVILTSANSDVSVNLSIDGVNADVMLNGGNAEYTFSTPLRPGEKDLTVSGNGVKLTGIKFSQTTEPIAYERHPFMRSDYEEANKTAFIIKEGSPVIKINSSTRYIDYDDMRVTPRYIGGSLYLPADILATALGCYFEEDRDKGFMILSRENRELLWLDGEFKLCTNQGDWVKQSFYAHEADGKTYLPVRAVSEAFGEYIYYKNGFVAGDYRSRAKALLNDYYDEVESEFSSYMLSDGGKTYYVAQTANASDKNDGSYSAPFKTISKAAEIAKAGDTVIIREGTYRETVTPKNDGEAGAPITFKAAEGEKAVVSALDVMSDFADYKDGLLIGALDKDMGDGKNQVFYNGKYLVEARYPNPERDEDGLVLFETTGLKLDPVWITQEDIKIDENDKNLAYSDTLLQEEEGHWDGATLVQSSGLNWALGTAKVYKSEPGKLHLQNTTTRFWWKGEPGYPNYGYLTGHINCIDLPGEWTTKKGILYIMPPEGETAKTLTVEVKQRQLLFNLDKRSNIVIDGISGVGGSVTMNESTMCVINNCDLDYITHYTYSNNQRDLVIDADESPLDEVTCIQRGEVGIYFGGTDNAMVNTRVNHSAGVGAFIHGTYPYIYNNSFENIAYGGGYGGAIHFDTENWRGQEVKRGGGQVLHNSIKYVARNGISWSRREGTGWDPQVFLPTEVAYNEVCNTSVCGLDTGSIYLWGCNVGDDFTGTDIHHNWIYSTEDKAPQLVGGIYNDANIINTNSYNNLFFARTTGLYKWKVFEQTTAESALAFSTVYSWYNTDAGIKSEGKASLTMNDFPGGVPFKAGSYLNGDEFDLTYKYYAEGNPDVYEAADAVMSEGVKLEDEKATFTNSDQWIKFENVDFDKGNALNIVYTDDYYQKASSVCKVVIGDSLDSEDTVNVTLPADARSQDGYNLATESFIWASLTGKHTVWIQPAGNWTASIKRIYLTHVEEYKPDIEYDYKRIIAGTFGVSKRSATSSQAPTPQVRPGFSEDPILIGSWGGGWVRYQGVKVTEPANYFNIATGSSGEWTNGTITLRIMYPTNEPLVSITPNESHWKMDEQLMVPLNRTLQPGTYDFYLTFEGAQHCSDIFWFGLE